MPACQHPTLSYSLLARTSLTSQQSKAPAPRLEREERVGIFRRELGELHSTLVVDEDEKNLVDPFSIIVTVSRCSDSKMEEG